MTRFRTSTGLMWHAWGEGKFSVFHPDTGETHLLNAFPAEILTHLRDEGMARNTLLKRIADLAGIPAAQLGPQFDATLNELQSLELVRIEAACASAPR